MSYRLFLTLFSFFIIGVTSLNASADLIEEIQGQSQKEREIRWLWKYVGELIRSCAQSGSECQTPEIRPVIDRLIKEMPTQPQAINSAWGKRLVFVSGNQNPGRFRSDTHENHRIAISAPNGKIFINTDLMENLEFTRWIGILAHEAVHDLEIPDDSSRLPDRVGTAVAVHAMPHWKSGNMAEFGHADTSIVFFNDPALDRPTRILFHTLQFSGDHNATPNPRVPICKNSEKFIGQSISSPLWRVRQIRGDKKLVTVSAAAHVQSRCRDQAGTIRQVFTNFSILADLKFSRTFNSTDPWWELSSTIDAPTLRGGNNDGQEEMLDMNRTFIVRSIEHNQPGYIAGEEWQTRVVVESTDAYAPKECSGYFSAAKWFFSKQVGTTMFEFFSSCQVTFLKDQLYEVRLKFHFPKNARPDSFALAFIYFPGEVSRFAIPPKPKFVELNNPTAAPALKVLNWRVLGLQERNSLGDAVLTNSYNLVHNQAFWLEVDFAGIQTFKRHFFDIDFIITNNGQQILFPWNADVTKFTETKIILKTESIPIPEGTRQRYQMQLPPTLSSLPLDGFKLKRISIETDDFAWTELEIPNFLEALFLTRNYELGTR